MARGKICEQTGKVMYTRHQDAAKVIGRIHDVHRRAAVAHVPRSTYQCEHCRRWHITSYEPAHTRAIQRSKRRKQQREDTGQ